MRLRSAKSASVSRSGTDWPSTMTLPESGRIRPPIKLRIVVLPLPLPPMMAVMRPCSACSVRPLRIARPLREKTTSCRLTTAPSARSEFEFFVASRLPAAGRFNPVPFSEDDVENAAPFYSGRRGFDNVISVTFIARELPFTRPENKFLARTSTNGTVTIVDPTETRIRRMTLTGSTPPPWLDLGDGITLIDSGYHRPGAVAFYLLVEGDQAAFIDTGTYSALPNALSTLAAHGLAAEEVAYVIPTHVHLDHAGGVGAIMRQFPNAPLVVHPRGTRHMIDPTQLLSGVAQIYGPERADREFGKPIPVAPERVIEAPDNFTLDLNGRSLRFLDTPGHARHHFCVFDERSGTIFSGDTLGVSYRQLDTARGAFIFPTTSPVQFEPEPLHRSIDRLLASRPRLILLTHFRRVDEISRLPPHQPTLIEAFF